MISSVPQWKRGPDESAPVASESSEYIDVYRDGDESFAVTALHFSMSGAHQSDTDLVVGASADLVVATPSRLLIINMRSFEVEDVPHKLPIAGAVGMADASADGRLVVAWASAFSPQLCLGGVNTAEVAADATAARRLNELAARGPGAARSSAEARARLGQVGVDAGGLVSVSNAPLTSTALAAALAGSPLEPLTVFGPEDENLPPDSPLALRRRSGRAAGKSRGRGRLRGRGKHGGQRTGRGRGRPSNRRVGSSGYGKTYGKARLFAPPTKGVRKGGGARRGKQRRNQGAKAALAGRTYPADCGLLVSLQKEHSLPPVHDRPISAVSYNR